MRCGMSLISESVESNRAEQNLVNADLQPSITPCKKANITLLEIYLYQEHLNDGVYHK